MAELKSACPDGDIAISLMSPGHSENLDPPWMEFVSRESTVANDVLVLYVTLVAATGVTLFRGAIMSAVDKYDAKRRMDMCL